MLSSEGNNDRFLHLPSLAWRRVAVLAVLGFALLAGGMWWRSGQIEAESRQARTLNVAVINADHAEQTRILRRIERGQNFRTIAALLPEVERVRVLPIIFRRLTMDLTPDEREELAEALKPYLTAPPAPQAGPTR